LIDTKNFKYENLRVFLCVSNSNLLLQKNEYKKNCIMKTKGPFMKLVSLNAIVKHALSQPNLDTISFLTHFRFFNFHINE
jgi:hypothetical protein